MRRADRKRPSKSFTTSSNGSSVAYTAGQQEQLRRGLRILARIVVRAHLRREVYLVIPASPETPREGEAGA